MGFEHVDGESKLSPVETLVLDEDELAELDQASLTSIMRDASLIEELLEKNAGSTTTPDALDDAASECDD